MSHEDQRALVGALARDFPLFAEATIARWVGLEVARRVDTPPAERLAQVRESLATTLRELSRREGATAEHLPLSIA